MSNFWGRDIAARSAPQYQQTRSCCWRIANYRLNTGTWTVLFLKATFSTLPCHEGPAADSRTPFDNTGQTPGTWRAKAIIADSLLMKQQLIVINRSRRRAPNLTIINRLLLGFWSLFLSPHRIQRAAVILRPSTLLNFHNILKKPLLSR